MNSLTQLKRVTFLKRTAIWACDSKKEPIFNNAATSAHRSKKKFNNPKKQKIT
ncbi:hypothetical protein HanRHA438_Chr03g0115281 [Helianthus annuus]|nr:hypothetical protein HanRHA438_Chr03g0115281 [Helianthus annuus]